MLEHDDGTRRATPPARGRVRDRTSTAAKASDTLTLYAARRRRRPDRARRLGGSGAGAVLRDAGADDPWRVGMDGLGRRGPRRSTSCNRPAASATPCRRWRGGACSPTCAGPAGCAAASSGWSKSRPSSPSGRDGRGARRRRDAARLALESRRRAARSGPVLPKSAAARCGPAGRCPPAPPAATS